MALSNDSFNLLWITLLKYKLIIIVSSYLENGSYLKDDLQRVINSFQAQAGTGYSEYIF